MVQLRCWYVAYILKNRYIWVQDEGTKIILPTFLFKGYYEWRADGGDIVGKEYLPVKQLRFGDTGSLMDDKKGKYTLGPLYCEGDGNFRGMSCARSEEMFYIPKSILFF